MKRGKSPSVWCSGLSTEMKPTKFKFPLHHGHLLDDLGPVSLSQPNLLFRVAVTTKWSRENVYTLPWAGEKGGIKNKIVSFQSDLMTGIATSTLSHVTLNVRGMAQMPRAGQMWCHSRQWVGFLEAGFWGGGFSDCHGRGNLSKASSTGWRPCECYAGYSPFMWCILWIQLHVEWSHGKLVAPQRVLRYSPNMAAACKEYFSAFTWVISSWTSGSS